MLPSEKGKTVWKCRQDRTVIMLKVIANRSCPWEAFSFLKHIPEDVVHKKKLSINCHVEKAAWGGKEHFCELSDAIEIKCKNFCS